MIIIGIKFFVWGSERTPQAVHCGQCGATTPFIIKKGMRFVTIFFVIPILPISGISHLMQCPNCATRYQYTPAG